MTRHEKRRMIAAELWAKPSWSNRRLAALLGVDAKTISAVRRELLETGEIVDFDTLIGTDGIWRPATMSPFEQSPED